jgi:hypothetical protein
MGWEWVVDWGAFWSFFRAHGIIVLGYVFIELVYVLKN